MEAFAYASPKTLKEATGLLANEWGQVDVLAGGTDLISLMKDHIHTPKTVVNIKALDLRQMVAGPQGLRIGAAVTIDELMNSAAVKKAAPSLHQAAMGITSPQLRNMGTVGGDLCQRPRCWYFRNGFGLLALDNNGQSMVVRGENKYHAIFGGGPAYFVSASSFGPVLASLGAKLKLASASGEREVEAAKFFVAPSANGVREIALLPNEILTEIVVPANPAVKSATYEVRHREAIADWPLATASVALTMAGTRIQAARVVLGHVAPTPWTASKVEAALTGQTISASLIEKAALEAADGAKPLSQNGYKVQLVKTAVKRALGMASGIAV